MTCKYHDPRVARVCFHTACDNAGDRTIEKRYWRERIHPTSGAAAGIVLGFSNETPRAAPEESKTGRGIVLVFPHETPRTGLTALTGRGISNYGATARVSQ